MALCRWIHVEPVRLDSLASMRFHIFWYLGVYRNPSMAPSHQLHFINNTNQHQPPFLIFHCLFPAFSFVQSAIELISFPVYLPNNNNHSHHHHQHKIFPQRSTTFFFTVSQLHSQSDNTSLKTQSISEAAIIHFLTTLLSKLSQTLTMGRGGYNGPAAATTIVDSGRGGYNSPIDSGRGGYNTPINMGRGGYNRSQPAAMGRGGYN